MDAQRERAVRNETLFREVNERLEGLNESFAPMTRTYQVVCECGQGDCLEHIHVPCDAYEQVRADGARFLVLPGHEDGTIESILERTDGYLVVRKRRGKPRKIADESDPRS